MCLTNKQTDKKQIGLNTISLAEVITQINRGMMIHFKGADMMTHFCAFCVHIMMHSDSYPALPSLL